MSDKKDFGSFGIAVLNIVIELATQYENIK